MCVYVSRVCLRTVYDPWENRNPVLDYHGIKHVAMPLSSRLTLTTAPSITITPYQTAAVSSARADAAERQRDELDLALTSTRVDKDAAERKLASTAAELAVTSSALAGAVAHARSNARAHIDRTRLIRLLRHSFTKPSLLFPLAMSNDHDLLRDP